MTSPAAISRHLITPSFFLLSFLVLAAPAAYADCEASCDIVLTVTDKGRGVNTPLAAMARLELTADNRLVFSKRKPPAARHWPQEAAELLAGGNSSSMELLSMIAVAIPRNPPLPLAAPAAIAALGSTGKFIVTDAAIFMNPPWPRPAMDVRGIRFTLPSWFKEAAAGGQPTLSQAAGTSSAVFIGTGDMSAGAWTQP